MSTSQDTTAATTAPREATGSGATAQDLRVKAAKSLTVLQKLYPSSKRYAQLRDSCKLSLEYLKGLPPSTEADEQRLILQILDTCKKTKQANNAKWLPHVFDILIKMIECGAIHGDVGVAEQGSANGNVQTTAESLMEILNSFNSTTEPLLSLATPSLAVSGSSSSGSNNASPAAPSAVASTAVLPPTPNTPQKEQLRRESIQSQQQQATQQQPQQPAGSPSPNPTPESRPSTTQPPTQPAAVTPMLPPQVNMTVEECPPPVQLQILKVCLAAATASGFGVHGSALMGVLRICHVIYSSGQVAANVEAAKGILRQIVIHIFGRFESVYRTCTPNTSVTPPNRIESPTPSTTPQPTAGQQKISERVARLVIREIIDRATSEARGGGKNGSSSTTNNNTNTADVDSAFGDCSLLFRWLCKLSLQPLPKDTEDNEFVKELRSKVYALELLYNVVENAGPALKTDWRFIELLQKHLIASMVSNGVSTISRVLKYTVSIIRSLLKHFRAPLKRELGLLLPGIVLKVLESPNSVVQQKWLILQLLQYLCGNMRAFTDIFLNYDCDEHSPDIAARLVSDLSRISQGLIGVPTAELTADDVALKILAMDSVSLLVKTLLSWSREGMGPPQQSPVKPIPQKPSGESLATSMAALPSSPLNLQQSLSMLFEEKELSAEDLDAVEKTKQHKTLMNDARAVFNAEGHKSVDKLKKMGLVGDTPESIAKFIKDTEGIDKRSLGDFICGSKPLCKKVLTAYVELFSFRGMTLDEAVRFFLGTFLITGEGAVIYRVLENFANQYYKDNAENGRFANADAVFQLAYALVVLATDAHNVNVKQKITFAEWVQMLKTLGLQMDLDFLRGIHDRIVARRLELNVDSMISASAAAAGANTTAGEQPLTARQKWLNFVQESAGWVDANLKLLDERINNTGNQKFEYLRTNKAEFIRPLFRAIWSPTVACFAKTLEHSDDAHIVDVCLTGFEQAVHLTCTYQMAEEKTGFMTALEKFTVVAARNALRVKDALAIKTLLNLGHSEGNLLHNTWQSVLSCVSMLEELSLPGTIFVVQSAPQATAGGGSTTTSTVASTGPKKSLEIARQVTTTPSATTTTTTATPPSTTTASPMDIKVPALAVDAELVTGLFTATHTLSDSAVVDFVSSLCQVSIKEIATGRTWCLKKLVEIVEGCLVRDKAVWGDIWAIFRLHFVECGCREQHNVSATALNLLLGFCTQFLTKEPQPFPVFQRDLLSPFEVIVETTDSAAIKLGVLQAMKKLVATIPHRLSVGWKSVISVLMLCALDEAHNKSFSASFEFLSDIIKTANNFQLVRADYFIELVNLVVLFGKSNAHAEVCMKSISYLDTCITSLLPDPKEAAKGNFVVTDGIEDTSEWFPILSGLSAIVAHPHIDVRSKALSTLFAVFYNNGKLFSPRFWDLAYHCILLPIFDSAKEADGADPDTEWLNTTCFNAAQSLITLFTEYFDAINFLLPDVLDLLRIFIAQGTGIIADIGSTSFYQLVRDNGVNFTRQMWSSVVSFLEEILMKDSDLMRRFMLQPNSDTPSPAPTPSASNELVQHEDADAKVTQNVPSSQTKPSEPQTAETEKEQQQQHEEGAGQKVKCANCGKLESANTAIKCPICKGVEYCCIRCQKEDWVANHQHACNPRKTITMSQSTNSTSASSSTAATRLRRASTVTRFVAPASVASPYFSKKRALGVTPKYILARLEVIRTVIKAMDEVVLKQYERLSTDDLIRVSTDTADAFKATTDVIAAKETLLQQPQQSTPHSATTPWASRLLEQFFKKERELLSFHIRLVFRLFNENSTDVTSRESYSEQLVLRLCDELMSVASVSSGAHHQVVDKSNQLPNLLLLLDFLLHIQDRQYRRHINKLYSLLSGLITHENLQVRELVQHHFNAIGRLFIPPPLPTERSSSPLPTTTSAVPTSSSTSTQQ